jgi:hypothetical protein
MVGGPPLGGARLDRAFVARVLERDLEPKPPRPEYE